VLHAASPTTLRAAPNFATYVTLFSCESFWLTFFCFYLSACLLASCTWHLSLCVTYTAYMCVCIYIHRHTQQRMSKIKRITHHQTTRTHAHTHTRAHAHTRTLSHSNTSKNILGCYVIITIYTEDTYSRYPTS